MFPSTAGRSEEKLSFGNQTEMKQRLPPGVRDPKPPAWGNWSGQTLATWLSGTANSWLGRTGVRTPSTRPAPPSLVQKHRDGGWSLCGITRGGPKALHGHRLRPRQRDGGCLLCRLLLGGWVWVEGAGSGVGTRVPAVQRVGFWL